MATWCFAETWVEYASGNIAYFVRLDPLGAVVAPILALVAILTVALLAAWEVSRRRHFNRKAGLHLAFLALCLAPAGAASVVLVRVAPVNLAPLIHRPWFWPAVLAAGVAPLGFACRRPQLVSRLVRSALLYSWPVLLLILAQAWRVTLAFPQSAYADGELAAPLQPRVQEAAQHTRVVWIIFDELSQTVAFAHRPAGLVLPNLDRLKEQSFAATAAMPPSDATKISLPSLILGQRVFAAQMPGPGDLRVTLSPGGEPVSWSALRNVFDTARDLGCNTALAGWYHPYGRVLSRSLTECYWTAIWMPPGAEEPSEPQTLWEGMRDRVALRIADFPLLGHLPFVFPQLYRRQEKMTRLAFLMDRARKIVRDPSIGLALLHLPVPHPPAVYSRARGRFTARERAGYLDGVALADREMGLLRQAMEEAGLWDSTAVLVSADHGWRPYLWRGTPDWTPEDEALSRRDQDTLGVPFLLKFPQETSGAVYTRPFGAVVTRRLITAILSGQLRGPAGVPALIEGR